MHVTRAPLTDTVAHYVNFRKLSPRQARIIFEHVRGRQDKEIASALGVRQSTVYEHWRRMAQKCGMHLKSEVVADFHTFVWSRSPFEAAGG